VTQPFLIINLVLENPTEQPQTIFLENGRCFEILNPSEGLQNAVVAQDTEITIPPNTETRVEIPAYCLNRYRKMDMAPHPATVTPFIFSHPCSDQLLIWEQMEKPAA
jgi:hypothetical protein